MSTAANKSLSDYATKFCEKLFYSFMAFKNLYKNRKSKRNHQAASIR